jgi:DNA primase
MAKHAIRREGRVMVVEGYFDVVRLVSAGFEWVVAPLGTALTEDQAALLPRFAKQAYLLYDNDLAGLKATFKSGDQLLRQQMSVLVVTLPEGEDPDSFVDKYGGEKLNEQLSGAVDIFERKLNELQRNGYFADLHRKRVAIDKLLPTLRATADSVTREIYIARASEVSGVSREVLEREVSQMSPRVSGSHSARPPAPPPPEDSMVVERRTTERRRAPKPAPGIERSLVRILLHDRSHVEQVAEHIGPEELRDPALRDIYRALLAVAPDDSLEVVAGRLDPDSEELFAELQREPIGEGEEVQRSLAGSITRIRRTVVQRKMDEITRAIRIATPAEQDVLISEKRRLMDDLAALGGGSFKSFDRARQS